MSRYLPAILGDLSLRGVTAPALWRKPSVPRQPSPQSTCKVRPDSTYLQPPRGHQVRDSGARAHRALQNAALGSLAPPTRWQRTLCAENSGPGATRPPRELQDAGKFILQNAAVSSCVLGGGWGWGRDVKVGEHRETSEISLSLFPTRRVCRIQGLGTGSSSGCLTRSAACTSHPAGTPDPMGTGQRQTSGHVSHVTCPISCDRRRRQHAPPSRDSAAEGRDAKDPPPQPRPALGSREPQKESQKEEKSSQARV